MAVSVTDDDVFTALRSFLLAVLPAGTEVVQGQNNRVPMPGVPNFVVLTPTRRVHASGPYHEYDPVGGFNRISRSTQAEIQLDVYGPASTDNAQIAATLLRDDYGCEQMSGTGVQPLYCDDGQQMPLVTGEQQYLARWTMKAMLQLNPVVSTDQQFADTISVTILEAQHVPVTPGSNSEALDGLAFYPNSFPVFSGPGAATVQLITPFGQLLVSLDNADGLLDLLSPLVASASVGAVDAGKLAALDGDGRIGPSLLAPDGNFRTPRIWQSANDLAPWGEYGGTQPIALFNQMISDGAGAARTVLKADSTGKGIRDTFGVARGTPSSFLASKAGDRIYLQEIQAAGIAPGSTGHAGNTAWKVDANPTVGGEIAGYYSILVGTGLQGVALPTTGVVVSFETNSRKQINVPGPLDFELGHNQNFGACWVHARGGSAPSQAPVKWKAGSTLLAAPEPFADEVDALGNRRFTDAAGVPRRYALEDMATPTVATALATCTATVVDYGPNCALVEFSSGGTGPGTASTLFTLTLAHAFPAVCFPTVSAANLAASAPRLYVSAPTPGTIEVVNASATGANTTFRFWVRWSGK